MTNTMVCAIFTPTSSLLHSSSLTTCGKPFLCALSSSAISIPKNAIFHHVKCIPQLGFTPFSQWNGLKHLGISISQFSVKMERKGKFKGKGVYASLFGVGAPEALVIGVVALLVFGPKGLAEVARNLGKTLRSFQPTIKELQQVSREFKSTLEREIGLDDIDDRVPKPSSSNTTKPAAEDLGTNTESNGIPSETEEDSTGDSLKITSAKLIGALAQLQKEQAEEAARAQSQAESQTPQVSDSPQAIDAPQEVSSETTPTSTPTQSPGSDTLQEATSAVPAGSAPSMPENET